MERDQALRLLKENVTSENLINHCLGVEAIMRGLAEHLHEDVEKFGLAGLLHDIDWDITCDDFPNHSLIAAKMLEEQGLPEDIVYAVKVHNDMHGLERRTMLDKTLFAADPVSGFITAAAMVRPDKKLEQVELKSLKKRFKEKAFARGANRETISTCVEIGMDLDEFLNIGLQSMKKIADQIGL